MELNKVEVAILEDTVTRAIERQISELNELQLAFVGGGIGETVL